MANQRDSFRDIDDRTEDLRDLADQYPDIWREFLQKFELSTIYHENALEGVVLTHAELVGALKGRPIATDTYGSIRSLKGAMELVRREASQGTAIDLDLVTRIHGAIGASQPDFVAARYRKDIPLHRAYFHDIAQPNVIPTRLAKLMDWAGANEPDDDDAVRYAAHLHHEFMSIFPFAEHTGKTGRLLVNFVLLRHGYMPVIFHATERQRYYDTLRLSRKEMEALLLDMMGNCIENASTYVAHVLAEREKQRSKVASVG
jgi:Fic family protein